MEARSLSRAMFRMKGRRQAPEAVQVLEKILDAEQGPNSACSRRSNGRTDEEQPSSRGMFARCSSPMRANGNEREHDLAAAGWLSSPWVAGPQTVARLARGIRRAE
jgi:hypothetical protein